MNVNKQFTGNFEKPLSSELIGRKTTSKLN